MKVHIIINNKRLLSINGARFKVEKIYKRSDGALSVRLKEKKGA